MSGFKEYRRTGTAQPRRYEWGEDLTHVRISQGIDPTVTSGWIARNPKDYQDQWFITEEYFQDNFDPKPLHHGSEFK